MTFKQLLKKLENSSAYYGVNISYHSNPKDLIESFTDSTFDPFEDTHSKSEASMFVPSDFSKTIEIPYDSIVEKIEGEHVYLKTPTGLRHIVSFEETRKIELPNNFMKSSR